MSFGTWIFLAVFLPLTVIGYFVFAKLKNKCISIGYLIFANLVFYGYVNVKYVFYFLICSFINYLLIKKLLKNRNKKILLFGIVLNLGALILLKYFNFFISTVNRILKTDYNLLRLFLPLGISFFTFQFVALIYDTYKGNIEIINFMEYMLYVTFFPKVVQGPIMLYQEFHVQYIRKKFFEFSIENFCKGLYIFTFGIAKKVLVADVLGKIVNPAFSGEAYINYNSTMLILVVLCYTFQIYFDFSGYSDMATGISLLFNIKIPQNFNSPYKAMSINSFWDRWHMSLTRFFTKYLYIPMGGSRRGEKRTYVNVMIVFFLSGLWHGANYTFLIWGILHGLFSVVERKWNIADKMMPVIRWIYTFVFINITWIFFRAESLRDALLIIKGIFKCNFSGVDNNLMSVLVLPEVSIMFDILNIEQYLYLFPFVFLSGILLLVLQGKNSNEKLEEFFPTMKKVLVISILFAWSVLSFGNSVSFLYEMF